MLNRNQHTQTQTSLITVKTLQIWQTWSKTAENKCHSKKNHHTEWTTCHVSVLQTWRHKQGSGSPIHSSYSVSSVMRISGLKLQLCMTSLTESYEVIYDGFIQSEKAEQNCAMKVQSLLQANIKQVLFTHLRTTHFIHTCSELWTN
jgi:hypothetical protein